MSFLYADPPQSVYVWTLGSARLWPPDPLPALLVFPSARLLTRLFPIPEDVWSVVSESSLCLFNHLNLLVIINRPPTLCCCGWMFGERLSSSLWPSGSWARRPPSHYRAGGVNPALCVFMLQIYSCFKRLNDVVRQIFSDESLKTGSLDVNFIHRFNSSTSFLWTCTSLHLKSFSSEVFVKTFVSREQNAAFTHMVIPERTTTCPGLHRLSHSQESSGSHALGCSSGFHIQVQARRRGPTAGSVQKEPGGVHSRWITTD